MNYYTRRQLVVRLQVGQDFLIALEEEEIVTCDAPEGMPEDFSEIMFERARVAHNLVEDLGINLPGVAVIIRMREEMANQRQVVEKFVARLRSANTPRD
jgi:hypothetical protein